MHPFLLRQIQQNYKKIGVQKAEKETIEIIKNALKNDNVNLRFLNMFGVEFYDPNFVLLGVTPGSNAESGDFELVQDIYKSSMSVSDKIGELKAVFDVNIDLNLFVLFSGQLVMIPDADNLANWIERNHFSEDCDIIVLPTNGLDATINDILTKDIGSWSESERRLILTYWIKTDIQLNNEEIENFVFVDSLISESENPFEKFYFKICLEVLKSYTIGEPSNHLKRF